MLHATHQTVNRRKTSTTRVLFVPVSVPTTGLGLLTDDPPSSRATFRLGQPGNGFRGNGKEGRGWGAQCPTDSDRTLSFCIQRRKSDIYRQKHPSTSTKPAYRGREDAQTDTPGAPIHGRWTPRTRHSQMVGACTITRHGRTEKPGGRREADMGRPRFPPRPGSFAL